MEIKPAQTETSALTNPIYFSPGTSNMDVDLDNLLQSLTDDEYFESLPPGFRFVPHEDELILYYLNKKIRNEKLPRNRINVLNLYEFNPEQLSNYTPARPNEWYFFTPRDRKYKNGHRPNRAADDGFWKATGCDNEILHDGEIIGYQKALVFYKGKPPKGEKTSWLMHEYRVNNPPPRKRKGADDMRLDDWVLCKIYNKKSKPSNTPRNARSNQTQIRVTNNDTDKTAQSQKISESFLYDPYGFPNYRHPNIAPAPDVHSVPPYQNADIYSTLAPITTVSPISSVLPAHSRLVPESTGWIDSNEFLDLDSLMNMENKVSDYSLFFLPPQQQ